VSHLGRRGVARSHRRTRALGCVARVLATVLLAGSLTAACDLSTGSPTSIAAPPTTSSTGPNGSGPNDGEANGSAPNAGGPSGSPAGEPAFDPARLKLGLSRVVGGLDQPVAVTGTGDGSGRLFVLEQPGRIRIVRDGQLVSRPFLDIRSIVSCCGERGLLGLAFPPDFKPAGGTFFIDYTDVNGDTVVAAVNVDGADEDVADRSSLRPLLHVDQPFANHNGGGLAFGPDGDLYIGMGDGGSGGDPMGNGQRLDTLLGKLLRIDVTIDAVAGQPYRIPADNPFTSDASRRPEIWAYGLRNPWRFSFDRETGDLWIGDVGQNAYEEIDRLAVGTPAGANLGWNIMEGRHCFASNPCSRSNLVLPIAEYGHGAGDCAVIGGYVYRGSAFPALVGGYVFGDECSGTIRGLVAAGPDEQQPVVLLQSGRVVSSFGESDDGELFLTDLRSGELYQVTATGR
jgi:glucose/arabinose dehydrogenase